MPEDAPWAQWIQLLLDGRNVPEAEIQRPTRLGFPRPSVVTVTLCELANAHSLSEFEIGRWLIVIISKVSAGHRGLGTLMGRFRAAGGEDRIIAVVVDSDPGFPSPGDDCSTWIPRWLAWRYKAGRFVPADRAEPLVVDGRGEISTLDAIGREMLSTVLDLEPGCLLQSLPVEPPAKATSGTGNKSASKPSANVVAPEPAPAGANPSRIPWKLLGAIVGAIVVLGGLASTFRRDREGQRVVGSPAAAPTAPALPDRTAIPTPPPVAPPPVSPTATAPKTPDPAAPEISADVPNVTTAPEPPPPPPEVVEEPVFVEPPAWEELINRGNRYMSRNDHDRAMESFQKALGVMKSAAETAANDSETSLLFGELALKLAMLQQNFASTAEAISTLTAARKVLGGAAAPTGSKKKAKPTAGTGSKRSELLGQIEAALGRMVRNEVRD